MNIYFIPFEVIPIRNYTLVPTFFPILEALQNIIFLYTCMQNPRLRTVYRKRKWPLLAPVHKIMALGRKKMALGSSSASPSTLACRPRPRVHAAFLHLQWANRPFWPLVSKYTILWSCSAPSSMPRLSPQSWRSVVLSWASSVLGTRKSHRGPGLGSKVAAASLVCCFWPKVCAQATMCEQGRYHGAKANFCSSTNLGVSGGLLRANCA